MYKEQLPYYDIHNHNIWADYIVRIFITIYYPRASIGPKVLTHSVHNAIETMTIKV